MPRTDEEMTSLENVLLLSSLGNPTQLTGLHSEITYELISGTDSEGSIVPMVSLCQGLQSLAAQRRTECPSGRDQDPA